MLHFRSLIVDKVVRETDDCVGITLAVPPEHAQEFDFVQGQHITVKAVQDGQELRRNYSICSAAGSGELTIAIKAHPGGRFSRWANGHLKAGDTLDVMAPSGGFHTALDPSQRKTYAAFAAGTGITPVISIIRTTLATEPRSHFVLFYANRDRGSIIFREALEDLKNRYMDRFGLHFFLTRESLDNDLYDGRLDRDRAQTLCRGLCPPGQVDDYFVCGPATMIDDVTSALVAAGANQARIHSERFTTAAAMDRAAGTHSQTAAATPAADAVRVTVILDGASRDFSMARDGTSVLNAALDAGIELPYSCMGGVCSTCRSKLAEGRVEMAENYALEEWELEEGFVLTCQSRPLTDTLTLDFDDI